MNATQYTSWGHRRRVMSETYASKVLGYGPVAYWPLNETSGVTGIDSSPQGNDGTYRNDGGGPPSVLGLTLAAVTGPDGVLVPQFTIGYLDIYSAGLVGDWSANQGTLFICAKVDDWAGGTQRFVSLRDDAAQYIRIRVAAANLLEWAYMGSFIQLGGQYDAGWMALALTWDSVAGEVKGYKNGIQIGETKVHPGGFGVPEVSGWALGIRHIIGLQEPLVGSLAHAAFWDTALTQAQIAELTPYLKKASPDEYSIVFTFDDGTVDHYTEAFAYMESVGLHKGTTYINYLAVGNPLNCSLAQLQEMYAAGWDIGNHDEHLDLSLLSQAEVETALTNCQTWLETNSMPRGAPHVAYPFGKRSADSDAAMAAIGMRTGRIATGYSFDPDSPPDYRLIPSPPVDLLTANDVMSLVEGAVLDGRVLVLQFHKIGPGGCWSVANFQALCDFIVMRGYQLSTISEMWSQVYG